MSVLFDLSKWKVSEKSESFCLERFQNCWCGIRMPEKKIDNRYLKIKTAHLYDLDQRDIVTSDIPFYLEYAKKLKGTNHYMPLGVSHASL